MKVRMYNLISELVERGALLGYRRAFKHQDNPPEGVIQDAIHDAIMNELCEYLIFDESTAD
jgi:hypothetical protein